MKSRIEPGHVLNVTVTGLPATSETISLVVPNSGGKTRRLAERFGNEPWACIEPGAESDVGFDATPDPLELRELLPITFTDGSRTLRGTINVPARRRFEDGDVLVYDKGQTVEMPPAAMDLLLGMGKMKPFGFSISGRVHPPVEDPAGVALQEARAAVALKTIVDAGEAARRRPQPEAPECGWKGRR